MERATVYTGLISSLLNIASSQDVFLTYYTHHGLTFVPLCAPVVFADNTRCLFAIVQNGFPLALLCSLSFSEATWFQCRKASYTVIYLKCCVMRGAYLKMPPYFSVHYWLLRCAIRLSYGSCTFCGFMHRSILHICNAV